MQVNAGPRVVGERCGDKLMFARKIVPRRKENLRGVSQEPDGGRRQTDRYAFPVAPRPISILGLRSQAERAGDRYQSAYASRLRRGSKESYELKETR